MRDRANRIAMLAILAILAGAQQGCGNGGGGHDQDGDADAVDDADAYEGDTAEGGDATPDGDAPEDVPDGDAEEEWTGNGPTPETERFCAAGPWTGTLVPATVDAATGAYSGYYNTFGAGTLELTKVIPEHPFHVRKIKAAFAGGSGQARIRLMSTRGRSYPDGYPDLDAGTSDLVPPQDITVMGGAPDTWIEMDVSSHDAFLLPTEHYVIVYEHLAASPYLAVEEVPAGRSSMALILVPTESVPYGVDGNFRLELEGDFFCSWADGDRWFSEDASQPFTGVASQRAAFADLDGDGLGGFSPAATDPFPEAGSATMLVFGDLDNDGDLDAFSAIYVASDGDGDGWTKAEGDCNDADAAVSPGAAESAGNGRDDDCDGVADDGASTADADADGTSIAAGDCDDSRADVNPGAAELPDNADNDCDGTADEDSVNTIQENDGTGQFTTVPSSGVEALDPSAAAALGDGNGDGFLDVYWGNWLVHYPDAAAEPDRYFTGNGDGTFTDAAASLLTDMDPRPAYGVLWADYDNDGDQDIWVGNYGYGWNWLWTNDGTGRYEEGGNAHGLAHDSVGFQGGNTFGGDWGDIDNDGDLDLYSADIAHPRYWEWSDRSILHVNGGGPGWLFTDHREDVGLVYDEGDVNAAFADFDNDGDLDLVVASLYGTHYSRLYRNEWPDPWFTDVTYETGTAVEDAVSPVWSDVDEDGDLDLVIADRTGPAYVHFFENTIGQDSAWIELTLEGTLSNRSAVGARVTLSAGGVTQIREVEGGGGHSNTQSTMVVHFGLGSATAIDEVTVRWPAGAEETITGLAPEGRFLVVEGSGTGTAL